MKACKKDGPLPSIQFELLMRVMTEKVIFDKHDNCIQDSVRGVGKRLGVSYSSVQRLIKDMMVEGLAATTKDIAGISRVMVNPAFLYFHNRYDKRFHRAMYLLGSHEKAVEWLNLCRSHDRLYNPLTGEVVGYFDTAKDLTYSNSYGKNDRDKIHQRDGYVSYADGEMGPGMVDVLQNADGLDKESGYV